MNWLKIKRVLLIILIFMNILFYFLNKEKNKELFVVPAKNIEQIKEMLYDNNINLYHKIDPAHYPMSKLKVVATKIDDNRFIKFFSNTNGMIIQIKNDQFMYTKDSEDIIMNREFNTVTYKNQQGKYPPDKFNVTEAQKCAEKFVKEFINDYFHVEKTSTKNYKDYYEIIFNEVYNNKYILSNYIKVKVYETGIKEAELIRYEPVEFVENEKYIYPVDEVLYNFMNYINEYRNDENKTIFIERLDLGYDLEYQIDSLENDFKLIPYYRIILSDGNCYYVDAYTNEIKEPFN